MIKPQPYELICNNCGWRKSFAPLSDVLIPGRDYVDACPECGNDELQQKTVDPVKGLLAELHKQVSGR